MEIGTARRLLCADSKATKKLFEVRRLPVVRLHKIMFARVRLMIERYILGFGTT